MLSFTFFQDIDCMPLNPFDNIPETLRPQNIVINRHCNTFKDMKLEDPPKDWRTGSFDIADGRTHTSATSYQMNTLMKQAKVLLLLYFVFLTLEEDGILDIH